MNYPLRAINKEGTRLQPSDSYYSDGYAARICDLYLTDELVRNESGRLTGFYRLHAKHDHTAAQAFAYDIICPKCHKELKRVGSQLSENMLGLYTCPCCNKSR